MEVQPNIPAPINVPTDGPEPVSNDNAVGTLEDAVKDPEITVASPPVVFLDIDGVMISGTQLLVDVDSCHKRIFPATTIAVINELVRLTGARIVINSTHSTTGDDQTPIREALVAGGLDADAFHEDGQTRYPFIERPEAVADWLERHPETDRWMAIDDEKCAPHDRMVLVDPMVGVTLHDLNAALKMLGQPPIIMFI